MNMHSDTGPAGHSQPVIRRLREDDLQALLAFGAALPKDDWLYLDIDLQSEATIVRLINAVEARNWRQFVAVVGEDLGGGDIVGYANVRQLPGWKRHVGDIALVVREDYRRGGVGTALASAVLEGGAELSLHKLVVEVVEEQVAGQLIFKRVGFRREGLLIDQAVDYLDNPRNLVVLGYQLPAAS
jgi:RimJ/RimL family protein N-acetyltransferase